MSRWGRGRRGSRPPRRRTCGTGTRAADLMMPARRSSASTARAGRAASPSSSRRTGSCRWRCDASATGRCNCAACFSLEPLTFSGRRLAATLPDREVYRASRYATSNTRTISSGAVGHLHRPARRARTWFCVPRLSGRAGRSAPVAFMQPRLGLREPDRAARPPPQDSTHISFGVFHHRFTYRGSRWKARFFNGPRAGRQALRLRVSTLELALCCALPSREREL